MGREPEGATLMPGHSHAQLAAAGRRFGGPSYQDAGLSWTDASDVISKLAEKARNQITAMGSVYGAATPAEIEQAAVDTYHQAETSVSNAANEAVTALEDHAKEALARAQQAAADMANERLKKAAPYAILAAGAVLVAVYLAAKQGSRRGR